MNHEGRNEERRIDRAERSEDREIEQELTKKTYLEICVMIKNTLIDFEERFMARLKNEFICNDDHVALTKIVWAIGVVSVVALAFSMMAIGMKLEESFLKIIFK